MFIQVGRGFGKASVLLEPDQITRLQKVGKIKSIHQFAGGEVFLTDETIERLRRRLALYYHPLAIETMRQFLIPAINAIPKTCTGSMGNDGDFDIVGYNLDILNLTAVSSSSPLD